MPVTHIIIGATDTAKAAAFYEAALGPCGYKKAFDMGKRVGFSCGEGQPPVMVGQPYEGTASAGNGTMIGFAADTRAKVREAYEAGLKAGGKDEGKPGPREAGIPNLYGAYLRDPTGNKIGIFCTKPGD